MGSGYLALKWLHTFAFPLGFQALCILTCTWNCLFFFFLFNLEILLGVQWYLILEFNLDFPHTESYWISFPMLIDHLWLFLCEVSLRFFYWVVSYYWGTFIFCFQSLPEICSGILLPVYGLSFHVPSLCFLNSLFLALPKSRFTFNISSLLFQKYNITTAWFHWPKPLLCTFFFHILSIHVCSNHHLARLFFLKQFLLMKKLQEEKHKF